MSAEIAFGDWLRQRRKVLDLTRDELARQVGCSTITLRKLEAEERRPSKPMAERLAEVLQIPPDDRPAFLRFARGDPFAGPIGLRSPGPTDLEQNPRHNLPLQLTSFIGRDKDMAQVKRYLTPTAGLGVRLLTLTGAGGVGKTRLALQAAAELLDQFPDGVWLVELAPLMDPALVAQTVASVLGIQEQAGRPILATLMGRLDGKAALIILDNCEHLIGDCAELAERLLRACPQLSILATSRESLGVAGETIYQIPTLSLPDPNGHELAEKVVESEAGQLFAERARAVLPGFSVSSDNATAVAQVCRELDGLPLAIELAAARVKVLEVEQIAARLNERFRLLRGGSRTAAARHQTLQALIDWSYDLLPAPDQALLQRLAVFVGGWTLETAEVVGTGEGMAAAEVLDLLTQLANKSLVVVERQPGQAIRYRLLETIREYALARLTASGKTDAVWRQLVAYYLEQAKTSGPATLLDPTLIHHQRLELERENLRAAMVWTQSGSGSAELALRLAGAVMMVWISRGHWNEARDFLEGALVLAGAEAAVGAQARARVLYGLGAVAFYQGDYPRASKYLEQSLRLFRELNDQTMSSWALLRLSELALEQGDVDRSRRRCEESLPLFRELGNIPGVAVALLSLGEVAVMDGDAAQATALLEESLALSRALDDGFIIGWGLTTLAQAAQIQGDYERAGRLHAESLARFREHGEPNVGMPWSLHGLGEVALSLGDATHAGRYFAQALTLFRDEGDRGGVSFCLAGLAGAAALDEELQGAARLWGAAESLRQSIGARQAPASRAVREKLIAGARARLGDEAFSAAWAAGEKLTAEEAVTLALKGS